MAVTPKNHLGERDFGYNLPLVNPQGSEGFYTNANKLWSLLTPCPRNCRFHHEHTTKIVPMKALLRAVDMAGLDPARIWSGDLHLIVAALADPRSKDRR